MPPLPARLSSPTGFKPAQLNACGTRPEALAQCSNWANVTPNCAKPYCTHRSFDGRLHRTAASGDQDVLGGDAPSLPPL